MTAQHGALSAITLPQIPPFVPRGWDQIEDPLAVRNILDHVESMPAFDVYARPELYELVYPGYAGDAEFYSRLARSGRTLYLGVGAGRILNVIHKVNPHVVGVDNSPAMLKLLRERLPHLPTECVVLSDAVEAPFEPGEFDTVVAPYSFLQVLPQAQVEALLRSVLRWLRPGGRFVTDTFSTFLIPFRRPGLETASCQVTPDIHVAVYIQYDHVAQTMKELSVYRTPGGEHVLEMHLHYFFPRELKTALRQAGFEKIELRGGYHNEPFDPAISDISVYSARKPAN